MKIVQLLFVLMLLAAPFAALADDLTEPAWVYKGRGDRYYRNGDTGRAIYEYKRALIRANRNGSVYPEVNLVLARIYTEEGLYDLALSQVDIVQKNGSMLQIPDLVYESFYTKAGIYISMERYDEALRVYESIIEKDDSWKSYSGMSLYELLSHTVDDRLKIKRFAEAYFVIGTIKYMSYNYENAIPAFKMAMLYQYKTDQTLKYLINCYEKVEDIRAVEYLLELMENQAGSNSEGRT